MYCNQCGAPVAAEQVVCTKCGHSTIGGRAAVVARTRVAGHAKVLAIFWFIIAAFWTIPAIVFLVLSNVRINIQGEMPPAVLNVIFGVLMVVFLVGAALSFVTGWGLLELKPWGRTMAIVMGILVLFHPPFGTALGVYTLVVLLPADAGDEYRRMSEGLPKATTAQ